MAGLSPTPMPAGAEFRLVLATRNEHKLAELAEILAPAELLALPAEIELPPETGTTFTENALTKARVAHRETGTPAIADDSGISAAALGGHPGIFSARYAGERATDEQNLAKLLAEVGEAGEDRRVAYVCALAVCGLGPERVFEARCEGTLAEEPRGKGGFGYDPAFVPLDTPACDGRTMAELSPAEKHAISHRGRAARLLSEALSDPTSGLIWPEGDGGR